MSEKIKKQVEETLAFADRIPAAKPKPYFYTRVSARLESQRESVISLLPSSLKIACTLLLILNASYFISSKKTKQDTVSGFANFYQINSSDIYNP